MLAVTVWEVATMGRRRPYAQLSDAQVILNADHFYYDDGKQVSSMFLFLGNRESDSKFTPNFQDRGIWESEMPKVQEYQDGFS